ncbi:RNA polymerase sigma factor [Wenjunlia tyrosinilytica]|uniref:RNA polymerase sigma E protein n=1 Tax=Wenjunlia tyrosinilytica TaxID=1544741 RepID=A0A917ZE75_9ACTN|nr:RNA polymerase sigma factor [Wenjunlia tyrosinilytica]GGO81370.1 putative RNA polymerase sigma E protein [Wenjunlia tyrosinilytica]
MGLPLGRAADEALLAGLSTGDPEIAVAFVRRFQRTVFGVAIAVVSDPQLAEDVAQQTFERAWRHAQVYDPRRGSVKTWLTTIAHNLAIDAVRARRPTPVDPEDLTTLVDIVTETPEQRAISGEASERLRSALGTLPREQARALVMAGIYGMTARQVAELEQIPLGTAKTRIRAAMGKLRTTLEPERAERAERTERAERAERTETERTERADHE